MCRARNSAAVCPGSKVHLAIVNLRKKLSLATLVATSGGLRRFSIGNFCDPMLHCLSRPLRKYPGEVLAMCIEDNQPQDCHNYCQRYTSWIQNNVIQNDVHNYWSKQHKTEGHEPIHKQQRTACDL